MTDRRDELCLRSKQRFQYQLGLLGVVVASAYGDITRLWSHTPTGTNPSPAKPTTETGGDGSQVEGPILSPATEQIIIRSALTLYNDRVVVQRLAVGWACHAHRRVSRLPRGRSQGQTTLTT